MVNVYILLRKGNRVSKCARCKKVRLDGWGYCGACEEWLACRFSGTVQELLSDEANWIQGDYRKEVYAVDRLGNTCDPCTEKAKKFSLLGAFRRAYRFQSQHVYAAKERSLRLTIVAHFNNPLAHVAGFSDTATHAEILHVVKTANV